MFHFYFLCTKNDILYTFNLFNCTSYLANNDDTGFKVSIVWYNKKNITQIKVYKFLVFAQISILCVYHKRHGCAIVLNSKWLMEKFSIFRISLLRKIGIDENKHVWFCVCYVKSLNTNINEKISCPRDMNCQYIKKKIWFETKLYHPNRIVIHAIINESYTPLCMVTWNKSFF